MARFCYLVDRPVVYLDCLECEDENCEFSSGRPATKAGINRGQ